MTIEAKNGFAMIVLMSQQWLFISSPLKPKKDMKKEIKEKIEKAIDVLMNNNGRGYAWCNFCKRWDKLENFIRGHQHENPTSQEISPS